MNHRSDPPLVVGDKSYHQISEDIIRPIENRPSKLWWTGFLISVCCYVLEFFSVTREVIYGVGQWNLNKTVGWAWDIQTLYGGSVSVMPEH